MKQPKRRSAIARKVVLLVEDEVLIRHGLAEYLRDCDFEVVEAASTDEALRALLGSEGTIAAVLCAADVSGLLGARKLQQWVRDNRSDVKFIIADTVLSAAGKVAEMCEEEEARVGRPYKPQAVASYIRRLLGTGEETTG
jgi:DNA-binding NtrC family response regulator